MYGTSSSGGGLCILPAYLISGVGQFLGQQSGIVVLLPVERPDEAHELQVHVLRLPDDWDDALTATGCEHAEEQHRQYRQIECPA